MASERIFNSVGRRHHRRRYSTREWRAGAALLLALVLIVAWVIRRGARPDPALLPLPDSLLARAGPAGDVYRRPQLSWVAEPGQVPSAARNVPGAAGSPEASPWAPFPAGIVGEGWEVVGGVATFDAENAFLKIDGRDEFYLGFGLRSLHCLALAGPAGAALELEMFTLGTPADAAGALLAEVSDDAAVVAVTDGSLHYTTVNAGFLARGERYLRAIGADRGEATQRRVAAVLTAARSALPAGEVPWAFALFAEKLGIEPRRIVYHREDAFGLAFAREVYAATPPGHDGEWFVVRAAGQQEARALAGRFLAGFAGHGEPAAPLTLPGWPAVPVVRDRWFGALSAVVVAAPYVVGVRQARDAAEALDLLARLLAALDAGAVEAPALEEPAAGATPEPIAPANEEDFGQPRGAGGGGP